MNNIIKSEIYKLFSCKILWLMIAGGILPGLISWLNLINIENLDWKIFIHTSMIIYNSISLLTFPSFASFIWAREYEENTIELALCYPYPKYYFFLSKLVLMFIIIVFTSILFMLGVTTFGVIATSSIIQADILFEFLKMISIIIFMQFMLMPFMFLITIVTKQILSGIVLGSALMILCMAFQKTAYLQYIPFTIPMVLTDNIFGYSSLILNNYLISGCILSVTFIFSFIACMMILRKKWELAY